MESKPKTSEQISREWAESLLIYLDRASYEYRHWETTIEMIDDAERQQLAFWTSFNKEEARIERDKAFHRFLHHRSTFQCKD